jgi:hypothetical protein
MKAKTEVETLLNFLATKEATEDLGTLLNFLVEFTSCLKLRVCSTFALLNLRNQALTFRKWTMGSVAQKLGKHRWFSVECLSWVVYGCV